MEWIISPKMRGGDICPKSACYTNTVCGCKAVYETGPCNVKFCVSYDGQSCNEVYCVSYGGND